MSKQANSQPTEAVSGSRLRPDVLGDIIAESLVAMGLGVRAIDIRRSSRLGGGLLVTITLWRSECLNSLLIVEKGLTQNIDQLRKSAAVEFFWRYIPRSV